MKALNNDTDQHIIIDENDSVKVFEGLKYSAIIENKQLIEILDLNVEQLTYYLEDVILENPFIDLEYTIERQIPTFERLEGTREVLEMKENKQSLDTYLFEQIMLYRHTEIRDAMVKLIDYLDERGYLPYRVEELAEKIQMPEIVTLDAMTLIKQLEPAGIGAYDLRESLMIQTEQDETAPAEAYYLLKNYFKELNEQDYSEILKKTHITLEEIKESVNYYFTLRTNPASLFEHVAKINLIPDVTVKQSGEDISIRFNRQYYPRISFNQNYYNEMLDQGDASLTDYVKPHEAHYQELANNLRIREQLILDVIKQVVKAQYAFFSQESEIQTSLSIKQIASVTRLSDAIVYRIITNKNIEFNGYVYALTDFINVSQSKTREGLRADYIKDKINHILSKSDESLSDYEVLELLEQEKIIISEQVIKNYRQSLGK